jgi:hypothetical protein
MTSSTLIHEKPEVHAPRASYLVDVERQKAATSLSTLLGFRILAIAFASI